ncbi:MAG: Hpt domain-containing protein [Deltaproteobacteria bacterium]|nr:Hpt domain-containing protein [Deltaproteobacteria bacterium]
MPESVEEKSAEKITVHVDADIKDLISQFLEDWREEVKTMREALEKGDYETIRMLGHNMKGTGGACGFDDVTDIGAHLEVAAKTKNNDVIQKTLDDLTSYFERIEVIYE